MSHRMPGGAILRLAGAYGTSRTGFGDDDLVPALHLRQQLGKAGLDIVNVDRRERFHQEVSAMD